MTGVSPKPRTNRWLVLAVVCGGLFLIMLQSNVINLAVTRIQADYSADLSTVQWITTGYLLVFSMFLITFGRLGDAIGRRRIFMSGLAVYSLGALFCGLSAGLELGVGGIILGSLVQGVGGAAMMPATQSLIAANFEAKERGAALGVWGAVSGLAVAVGPTLGGLLTDRGLGAGLNAFFGVSQGWRYIYFLSCAIGTAVFLAAWRLVPESKDSAESKDGATGQRYDGFGILLSTLGVFALVFGLSEGSKLGWWAKKADLVLFGLSIGLAEISLVPVFLAAAAVLLVLFVLWERFRGDDALIDLHFFRDGNFAAGAAIAAILSFAMMGTFFLVPVFLQGVLGFAAIRAGLAMLPLALAVMVASPLAGRLSDKLGAKGVIMAGLATMGAGGFLLANFRPDTTIGALVFPFLVMGAGIGLAMSPITNTALRRIPIAKIGGASGLLSMIRQLGSVLGIAVLASVFASSMGGDMVARLAAVDPAIVPPAVSAKIIDGIGQAGASAKQPTAEDMDKYLALYGKSKREAMKAEIGGAMKLALCDSINGAFRIAALAAFGGALAGFALVGRKRELEA
jgi:EmrB/QacA subfamily drug resistance transporter